tara:strand:- start:167 stop:304 length:138 start_codon:yes stop_codon:yes gene_type:complete
MKETIEKINELLVDLNNNIQQGNKILRIVTAVNIVTVIMIGLVLV